jgi:hypothetical protein
MTQAILHFVDPSIPGVSGRDLARKAIRSVAGVRSRIGGKWGSASLRKDLSYLDLRQLRDIGLDRNAS